MSEQLTTPGDGDRKPFRISCGPCGHQWIVAYVPMETTLFCKTILSAKCPTCASGSSDHYFVNENKQELP